MEELGKIIGLVEEKKEIRVVRENGFMSDFFGYIPQEFWGGTVFREVAGDEIRIIIKRPIQK